MSSLRRPPGPVRQLSLQQPPRRQQVRRQRSAEDEKPLAVFANPIRTRLQCSDEKSDSDRPKVRVAWDENGQTVSNSVGVIARQIPGKSRPPTAKATRPLIGEKASILYSRQELAERLRLAWKQREKQKGNIDIFLAQNVVEDRCESRPSSCATSRPSGARDHDEPSQKWLTAEVPKIVVSKETATAISAKTTRTTFEVIPFTRTSVLPSDNLNAEKQREDGPALPSGSTRDNSAFPDDYVSFIEERMKEDLTVVNTTKDDVPIPDEDRDAVNDINDSISITTEERVLREEKKRDPNCANAKTRRANYSGQSNRVSTSGSIPCGSTERREKLASRDQPFGGLSGDKSRRTNSAPPQRRQFSTSTGKTQVSIVIETPTIGSPIREVKAESSVVESAVLKVAIPNRAIKSAPVKRRAKSGKRRVGSGLTSGNVDCGGEEDGRTDGRTRRSGGRGKTIAQPKPTDVVTMVSLVSSADSDSEIDQNSPRDDKLIRELRNKLPTTPIIKTSGSSPTITIPRKPVKSVSFQQESFDSDKEECQKEDRIRGGMSIFGQQRFPVVCRGNGSALPTPEEAASWRLNDTLSSVVAKHEIEESQDDRPVPVTDREKRCLAVPIGDTIRDKKRKLLRTRSTPPRLSYKCPLCPLSAEKKITFIYSEERLISVGTPETSIIPRIRDQECANEKNFTPLSPTRESSISKADSSNPESQVGLETEPEMELTSSEPQFHTRKERECWHLYRRMCDKGVYVSFDTVLRGMLTPTEYRLRQQETAGNC